MYLLEFGFKIIDSNLNIPAAHCFHDQNDRRIDITNFEIVVSKVTRDYNVIDNQNQKAFKV